jgi:integrase
VRRQVIEDGTRVSLEETKTKAAVHEVPLAASTLAVLAAHRASLEERTAGERGFRDQGLVFPDVVTGRLRSPRDTTHRFTRLTKRAGFPGLRLHEARHTAANLVNAQASGDSRLVVDILGTTDARFTMDTYVHTSRSRLALAALDLGLGEPEAAG